MWARGPVRVRSCMRMQCNRDTKEEKCCPHSIKTKGALSHHGEAHVSAALPVSLSLALSLFPVLILTPFSSFKWHDWHLEAEDLDKHFTGGQLVTESPATSCTTQMNCEHRSANAVSPESLCPWGYIKTKENWRICLIAAGGGAPRDPLQRWEGEEGEVKVWSHQILLVWLLERNRVCPLSSRQIKEMLKDMEIILGRS